MVAINIPKFFKKILFDNLDCLQSKYHMHFRVVRVFRGKIHIVVKTRRLSSRWVSFRLWIKIVGMVLGVFVLVLWVTTRVAPTAVSQLSPVHPYKAVAP
jgi:hypothetical protein